MSLRASSPLVRRKLGEGRGGGATMHDMRTVHAIRSRFVWPDPRTATRPPRRVAAYKQSAARCSSSAGRAPQLSYPLLFVPPQCTPSSPRGVISDLRAHGRPGGRTSGRTVGLSGGRAVRTSSGRACGWSLGRSGNRSGGPACGRTVGRAVGRSDPGRTPRALRLGILGLSSTRRPRTSVGWARRAIGYDRPFRLSVRPSSANLGMKSAKPKLGSAKTRLASASIGADSAKGGLRSNNFRL